MNVKLYIPKEDPSNKYILTHRYDLTKFKLLSTNINAVFCHLTLEKDPGNELTSTGYEYDLEIDIDRLVNYKTIFDVTFDYKSKESLLLILHDTTFNMKDLDMLYDNLEEIYLKASNEGNFSIPIDDYADNNPIRPRKIGISIIRR